MQQSWQKERGQAEECAYKWRNYHNRAHTQYPPQIERRTNRHTKGARQWELHKALTSQPWVMCAPICCTRSKMCSARDPFVI